MKESDEANESIKELRRVLQTVGQYRVGDNGVVRVHGYAVPPPDAPVDSPAQYAFQEMEPVVKEVLDEAFKAFHEGWLAYERGIEKHLVPYELGSHFREGWLTGWTMHNGYLKTRMDLKRGQIPGGWKLGSLVFFSKPDNARVVGRLLAYDPAERSVAIEHQNVIYWQKHEEQSFGGISGVPYDHIRLAEYIAWHRLNQK